jgi:hypothetical protein
VDDSVWQATLAVHEHDADARGLGERRGNEKEKKKDEALHELAPVST